MYNEIEQERLKIINEKINDNSKIYDFVKSHNKEQELDFDSQVLGGCGAAFSRDDYVFALRLGVPIGVIEFIDPDSNCLVNENEDSFEKDIKHFYRPINSLNEYYAYQEINPYPGLMVNPEYMTKKEARNMIYCLRQANNDMLFDEDTMNKLQLEIINSVPLKYNNAMKIFNKYFNKTIQRKIIYEYNVERDRFYYLSGLKELIPQKIKNNFERSER